MSKIYEVSTTYTLVRKYVIWVFRNYYNEYIVVGEENIPKDVPIIYAPNHLNALMDAMAVISVPPYDKPKVFLARADIFKLAKPIVKFLRFSKIIPAYRIRDGYDNLDKNKESFQEADNVLMNNAAMAIMPEGNQGDEKKIRQLGKGIFRIAFSTQQQLPAGESIKIIPVGIELGHLVKFGKHIIINIGKPIDVLDYMPLYNENPVDASNQLRSKLKGEMESLVQNLATEKYYACFKTTVDVVESHMLKEMGLNDNTLNRFYAGQKTAELLVKLEKQQPQEIEKLDVLCKSYNKELKKVNLRTKNLELSPQEIPAPWMSNLQRLLYILIGLPGFIVNILPFRIPTLFVKLMKIKYKGFYSSVYFAFSLLSFPLMYTLQSLLIVALFSFPWWTFFLLLPVQYYTGKLSFQLYKRIKSISAQQRLHRLIKTKQGVYLSLKNIKKQITEIVSKQIEV